ncbi:HdeD family acid-resistance protein [Streptomyces sp. NBC_01136]|uniref:HdeD family acid-resistance protein n=1 Tax=unclassified Streptomyces TaxID=2593676 RepID=UPI00325614FC|nr:HdeD family acid-resistance protein [Streptomyces sp. NBC_01136]
MTEAPNGSPRGPRYDDRQAHNREPSAAPEGPLHLIARSAWQAVLIAGIAALALGVMVLAWPGASLRVAGVLFGLYLLFSGVLQLVAAFGTHAATSLRVMAFISGALSILLGLFCFRGAMESILLLALWIGISWLFRGITQSLAAASDPSVPARGWQVFLGIVSCLAGIVLIVSPFASVAVLTLVGGCWLLAVGVTEIITAFVIRSRAKHVPRIL